MGFCLAELTQTSSLSRLTGISACRFDRLGSLSDQSGKMPELQNHALDVRVNIERGRAEE